MLGCPLPKLRRLWHTDARRERSLPLHGKGDLVGTACHNSYLLVWTLGDCHALAFASNAPRSELVQMDVSGCHLGIAEHVLDRFDVRWQELDAGQRR